MIATLPLALTRRLLEQDSLAPTERETLLAAARRLRLAASTSGAQPLRGRHVAIAGHHHETPSARLFERAAAGLGARVSYIGADAVAGDDERAAHAARLLGSLYDAVDCVAVAPDRARELLEIAAVPVFVDLGGEASPLRALLPALADDAGSEAEALLSLVQAVLLETVM